MKLKLLSAPLFVVGVLDSAYLLYEHYLLYSSPYCPINYCLPLLDLPFPSFILPLLGLIWFLGGILLFYILSYKKLLRLWQSVGLLSVGILFTYSVLIGYFCPYCYLAHACGLILIFISLRFT